MWDVRHLTHSELPNLVLRHTHAEASPYAIHTSIHPSIMCRVCRLTHSELLDLVLRSVHMHVEALCNHNYLTSHSELKVHVH